MSNFAFIKAEWPAIHADCARAESYLSADPRSACFYSRRAAEVLVAHLYDVMALSSPYQDDLSARVNDAGFKAKVGVGISQKLNLIRKVGNTAVHDTKPIRPDVALAVLRELHHVVVWAAFRYSTNPSAVPMQQLFDPSLAARASPLSHADVVKLAAKFKAQDEAYAKALAEKDGLAAAKDAELENLRKQLAEVQAANAKQDDHDYSEAETRDLFIDVLLREAGWLLSDARDREYEVTGMPNAEGKGFVDYVCGVRAGCRSRSSKRSGPPRAFRWDRTKPSCMPPASKPSSAAGRSSSTPTATSTGSGTTRPATRPARSRVSIPVTSWS